MPTTYKAQCGRIFLTPSVGSLNTLQPLPVVFFSSGYAALCSLFFCCFHFWRKVKLLVEIVVQQKGVARSLMGGCINCFNWQWSHLLLLGDVLWPKWSSLASATLHSSLVTTSQMSSLTSFSVIPVPGSSLASYSVMLSLAVSRAPQWHPPLVTILPLPQWCPPIYLQADIPLVWCQDPSSQFANRCWTFHLLRTKTRK